MITYKPQRASGFTIVELLIVIVVIAILAAISIVAYNGVTERSRQAKVTSDLATIEKAIRVARINNDSTMIAITQAGATEGPCLSKASGTDLAALPQSDPCWVAYNTAMDRIATASGMNIRAMKDPYGQPYYINANEAENQTTHLCLTDFIGTYRKPHVQNAADYRPIPLWSTSC